MNLRFKHVYTNSCVSIYKVNFFFQKFHYNYPYVVSNNIYNLEHIKSCKNKQILLKYLNGTFNIVIFTKQFIHFLGKTCQTVTKQIREKDLSFDGSNESNPLQCNVCQKVLSSKGNLKKHKEIHTGERKNVCGKSFVRK